MKEWAEKMARTCEQAYPMINEELKSDGIQAAAGRDPAETLEGLSRGGRDLRDRIVGSVDIFPKSTRTTSGQWSTRPSTSFSVPARDNPGWLVEGVSDYIRFFKFEPGKIGRINARTAHYNGSYRVRRRSWHTSRRSMTRRSSRSSTG